MDALQPAVPEVQDLELSQERPVSCESELAEGLIRDELIHTTQKEYKRRKVKQGY